MLYRARYGVHLDLFWYETSLPDACFGGNENRNPAMLESRVHVSLHSCFFSRFNNPSKLKPCWCCPGTSELSIWLTEMVASGKPQFNCTTKDCLFDQCNIWSFLDNPMA